MKNTCIQNSKTLLKLRKSSFPISSLPFSLLILALIRHGWRCINALAEVFVKQKLQRQKTAWMLFFAACSLLICNCDLFNKPRDPDYLKKIDAEIAWANAKKLTVHLSFDRNWGTSNPGQGKITPKPMDIRKGYAFDIEFSPDTAYSLTEWRAFSGELPQGWEEDLAQLEDEEIKSRELEMGKDFVLVYAPEIFSRGGNYSIKINVTGTITLIPWCKTEPRITRTEPRFAPNMELSRGRVISLYFNSPLDESSVHNAVTITSGGNDYSDHYTVGYFDTTGQFVVTLAPKSGNLPEGGKEITVTVKSGEGGIANIQGEWMQGEDAVYTWTTLNTAGVSVETWSAAYDEETNAIGVEWKLSASSERVEASYTVNSGPKIPLAAAGENVIKSTITGVGKINDANVRQGTGVTGVQEYEISIDIYEGNLLEESMSLKIWNIPGMAVSNLNPAIEIDSINNEQLTDSDGKTFVLTRDIVINGHTPIAEFSGKFYGNGHTVAINGGLGDESYRGFFGYVENAVIRDLTLVYNDTALTTATHVGGIAGFAAGTTTITNCIVKGGLISLVTSLATPLYLGGMVGQMESGVVIDTGYTSLNVELRNNGAGAAYGGGVVGKIGVATERKIIIDPPTEDEEPLKSVIPLLLNIRALGNVTCQKPDTDGDIFAGGIVGSDLSIGGKMQQLSYGGILKLGRSSSYQRGSLYGGGIVGYCEFPRYENCEFERNGRIEVPRDQSSDAYIGGIAGFLREGILYDADYPSNTQWSFYRCTARGDIDLQMDLGSRYASGIAACLFGLTANSTRISFKECVFEQGTLFFQSRGIANVGGVIGGVVVADQNYIGVFEDCFSRANRIEVAGSDSFYFGGFGGTLSLSTVKNCGNTSPIIINEAGQAPFYAYMGGFIGSLISSELNNCWSRGTVNSKGRSDQYTGGLVGYSNRSYDITENSKITQCRAEGNVNVVSRSPNRPVYTGGLVGYANYMDISESYATGIVTAQQNVYLQGSYAFLEAGGLVGRLYIGSIENCYAVGDVLIDDPNSTGNDTKLRAGGLVGNAIAVTVQYNYARGSVAVRSSNADVYAGGIAGNVEGDATESITGILQNNLAINENITGRSAASATLEVMRVYGRRATPVNTNYNYAWSTFTYGTSTLSGGVTLYKKDGYYLLPELVPFTSLTIGHQGNNGSNTTNMYFSPYWDYGSPLFWTGSGYLGFNDNGNDNGPWLFSNSNDNYSPRLRWEFE